jgi:hypothetical protein
MPSASLNHNQITQRKHFLHTYQRDDDFTVRVCFIVVLNIQGLSQDAVVVNLAIDSQSEGAVVVDEGLRTGVLKRKSILARSRGDYAKRRRNGRGTEVVFRVCPDGVGLHTDTDDAQALVAENCKSSQLFEFPSSL